MNNKRYLFKAIICTFLTCFIMSCQKKESINIWVHNKIGVDIPFKIDDNKILSEDRKWFIACQLTKSQMKKLKFLLSGNSKFKGWVKNNENRTFGESSMWNIDSSENIIVTKKLDSDSYDLVAVYLNLDRCIVIFFYGRTYRY